MIDFDTLKASTLAQSKTLVPGWLPSGRLNGHEWVALNPTRADKSLGSFSVNLRTGQWAEMNPTYAKQGTNLVDLYAYITNTDFATAAKVLSDGNPNLVLSQSQPHPIPKIIEPKVALLMPVPVDAPPAPLYHHSLGKASVRYTYKDVSGNLCGYVERYDFDKPINGRLKEFRPLFYSKKDGWVYSMPAPKKLVYGVEKLKANPQAKVLITEGEKACDAAQRLLPDWVCLSWLGGSNVAGSVDWASLKKREVYLWPDYDNAGSKAMGIVQEALKPKNKSVVIVDFQAAKEKWDLADAEAEGWTREQVLTVIDNNVMPDEIPSAVAGTITDNDYYLYLGSHDTEDKNSTEYYFLSRIDDGIKKVKESQFSPLKLTNIAPERWWLSFRRRKQDGNPESKESWMVNIINLIREESGVRRFHPEKIRGVGVWRESGASNGFVFHVGDKVVSCDGIIPFGTAESGFIYCNEKSVPIAEDEAIVESTQMLSQIIQLASWAHPTHAILLIGWMFISPVASVLNWRPHIYLWGPAHSGKTTMLGIINQYIGDFLISRGSKSTEPGIRGLIANTGKPVLLDEAEDYGPTERIRLDSILNLVTGASSGRNDTGIVKGTASGGVKLYSCNSVFCLASINPCIKETAHLERFAQLRMINNAKNRTEQWEKLQKLKADFDFQYPMFQQQLRRRVFNRLPQLLNIIDLFSKELNKKCQNSRIAEHIGSLMAGFWLMNNDETPTLQEIIGLVASIDLTENTEEEGSTEYDKLINYLLRHKFVYTTTSSHGYSERVEITVAEGIEEVVRKNNTTVKSTLKRLGININTTKGYTYIANASKDVEAIFKGTLGSSNWGKILGGVEGALRNVNQRFDEGVNGVKPVQKSVGLPTEMLLDFACGIGLIDEPLKPQAPANPYAVPASPVKAAPVKYKIEEDPPF